MDAKPEYAARLDIDYPEALDRVSSAFRWLWIVPIMIIFGLIAGAGRTVTDTVYVNQAGHVIDRVRDSSGGLIVGLAVATGLMIVFRQRYPRWWFDFARELTRFGYRLGAYAFLLTDQYPSTVEEQAVHVEIDYPDVEKDLNRWKPLYKWLLAIPHLFMLAFFWLGACLAGFIAWFSVLFTGRYPRGLFDYVVGVFRWSLRVCAYTVLLVTDEYPPFSLD